LLIRGWLVAYLARHRGWVPSQDNEAQAMTVTGETNTDVFLQFDSTTGNNRVLLHKHLVLDTSGAVTSQVDMAVTTASTKDFSLTSGGNVVVAWGDGSALTVAQGGEERLAVSAQGEVRVTAAADQDVLVTRCVQRCTSCES
jgi:hypothetical protein